MICVYAGMRAILAISLLSLNLVIGTSLVFALSLLSFFSLGLLKTWVNNIISCLCYYHARNIRAVLLYISGLQLQVSFADINKQDRHVIIANHRSQMDILILLAAASEHAPELKFFLKRSLMYVPFMGLFCYLCGYPFVDRFTKSQLRDRQLRAKQQQMLLDKCQSLFTRAVALVIFVEGTRFDKTKAQKFKYENLLPPQSLGVATAINAQQQTGSVLDATIVYAGDDISVWQVLSGKINKVQLLVEEVKLGQTINLDDKTSMRGLQNWLQELWQRKDKRISEILAAST